MSGESTFTLQKIVIDAKIGETYTLIPWGDSHYDSPLAAKDRFREAMRDSNKQENPIFIGMGDYLDLASWSERKVFQNSGLHESTLQTLDDIYDKNVDALYKQISFMRGKIIGLIEGNHHGTYQNGMTTTQKLCSKEYLNCKYLGISSFVRLVFRASGGRSTKIDIFAHHGKGGAGRMVGSDLNHIQAMSDIADAQILLMGHTHKKGIAMKTRLSLSDYRGDLKVTHQKILMCRTGSFLKGWEPNAPSYVAKACMTPTDLGLCYIKLILKREATKESDSFFVDIHGSI